MCSIFNINSLYSSASHTRLHSTLMKNLVSLIEIEEIFFAGNKFCARCKKKHYFYNSYIVPFLAVVVYDDIV